MYSLIIVDYCSMEKTVEYINHFFSKVTCSQLFHVIIVDNVNSPFGIKLLTEKYGVFEFIEISDFDNVYKFNSSKKTIIYCNAMENLGYAKGNNLGTKLADALFKDEYYIICNNDLELISPFIQEDFQKIFDTDSNIAVIGPRIIGLDGKDQSPHKKPNAVSHLIFNYWFKNWPFHWKCDYDYDSKSKKCYRVMGSFMVIRAKAFRKVEGFDPNTFMFVEEMILSERLSKKGYYNYFYNGYSVIHEHGASVKKTASAVEAEQWSFDSLCYYYKTYRNTPDFLIKIAKVNFVIYKSMIPLKVIIQKLIVRRK